ncbi:Uncharacterized protein Rs2_21029 [Raphanus sativus]|nr:Uncharacterized protein Rs2_21029 [Raphanus sativus]
MSGFTSKWLVQSSKAQTSFLHGSTLLDSSVLGVLAVEVFSCEEMASFSSIDHYLPNECPRVRLMIFFILTHVFTNVAPVLVWWYILQGAFASYDQSISSNFSIYSSF